MASIRSHKKSGFLENLAQTLDEATYKIQMNELKKHHLKDLVHELKESAEKASALPDAKELNPSQIISHARDVLSKTLILSWGKIYFERYTELYGTTESKLSSISSLFGYKTNQVANNAALLALGNWNLVSPDLYPQYILDVLTKFFDIQKNAKPGETTQVIQSIIKSYGFSLEEEKFKDVVKYYSRILTSLRNAPSYTK